MKGALEAIIEASNLRGTAVDVRICQRATMVRSKRLGLAYNFPDFLKPSHVQTDPAFRPGALCGMGIRELSRLALSGDWTAASVGVAAINSAIEIDLASALPGNGKGLLIGRCKGMRVAMIGHFNFADAIRDVASRLDILELRPSPGDLPASAAADVIPSADVTIITGTTLVNHTFDEIIRLAKKSFSVLIGPTTIMSPVLFDYGVDAICGTMVRDEAAAIRFLSEGGSFRDLIGGEQLIIERK
jgi:uncharacterized protein (DUF4213/DUF364 family)